MDEHIERYLERVEAMKSESTYDTYSSNLRQFDAWVDEQGYDVATIIPLEFEEYFLEMKRKGYAPNTIGSRFEAVRGLYKTLAGNFEVIEDTPFEELQRRDYGQKNTRKHDESDISYVTPEEKEALCEHVPSPKLRNELIIRLLWQTGVRKSELVEFELDDIDRTERSITVWSNKTKEHRTVYYQPSLDLLFDQWLDNGYRAAFTPAEECSYLLVTERSEHIHVDTVNEKVVKPAAEAAGIQEVMYTDKSGSKRYRVTPHALRYGHAVHALKSGIDVRTVQQHLGHANLEMTMKYLQLIDDDVKEGYRDFSASA
jgi:integrase/recombinase XerD